MTGTDQGILFDLDGVLVDTARYHFLAWKNLAAKWDYVLTPEANENLKGVSRTDSLLWILEQAGKQLSDEEFESCLYQKNQDYLTHIQSLDQSDLLPGALTFLEHCKEHGYQLALASASKNAPLILEKLGITPFFSTIIDGHSTTKSKPDPEVFLLAAQGLQLPPVQCIAIEDSISGIAAAKKAGCVVIGIGEEAVLTEADIVFKSLADFSITDHTIQVLKG